MTDRNIRSELLSLQQTDPALKADYDRRIREMMEVDLIPAHRKAWLIAGVISVFAALQWAWGAFATWSQVEWPVHVSLIALSVATLCWALLSLSIARRNRVIRAVHLPWGIGIITILAYMLWIMSFMQAGYAQNSALRMEILVGGLSALVAGGVIIILYRMEQIAFKTQEEQIRTQLQIADLIETIKGKS
jgi:hypothetical protein